MRNLVGDMNRFYSEQRSGGFLASADFEESFCYGELKLVTQPHHLFKVHFIIGLIKLYKTCIT